MEIERITVFGAGKIGSQLAFRAALYGYRMMLFDVHEAALLAARKKLQEISAQFMQDHYIPKYKIDKALERLFLFNQPE